MWRMLYDVFRFNASAPRLALGQDTGQEDAVLSIGEYLIREGYSESFTNDYLLVSPSDVMQVDDADCVGVSYVAIDWSYLEHSCGQSRARFPSSHACLCLALHSVPKD